MSFNINNPIGSVIDLVKDGLDKWGPADKTVVAQMKSQLDQLKESDEAKALSDEAQVQLAAMVNIQSEAKGESWLQRNWRPMVALWFAGLVGAYWFGFVAKNLTPASIDDLFGLVKLCLGGYYASRGVEKVAPHIVEAVKAMKS